MRITFLGHAGCFVQTRHGSVLCDPWFTPAYFGSWFPFPRNDALDAAPDLGAPDYLYISHLHRDHFDPEWLARNVSKRARVLLPEFGIDLLARELRALGFRDLVAHPARRAPRPRRARRDDPRHDLAGRRTARRLRDRARRRVGPRAQPERRPARRPRRAPRPRAVRRAAAPVLRRDLVSGRLRLPARGEGAARRERSGSTRWSAPSATSKAVDAAHVFPCAGPPCFLDPELFALNDLDRDPANIFPDQTVFLEQLAAHGIDRAHLVVPGSVIELDAGACAVTHPSRTARGSTAPFDRQARVPRRSTGATGPAGSRRAGVVGPARSRSRRRSSRAWFEPLLAAAPITSAGSRRATS